MEAMQWKQSMNYPLCSLPASLVDKVKFLSPGRNRYQDYKEYIEKLGFYIVPLGSTENDVHSVRKCGVHLYSIPPGKIYDCVVKSHKFVSDAGNELVHETFAQLCKKADGWYLKANSYLDEWYALERTKDYHGGV